MWWSPGGQGAGPRKGRAQETWEPGGPLPLCSPPDRFFPCPSKLEKRSIFLERGGSLYVNSDEEDGYGSPDVKRRGASVDDFLRGSELGKQVSVDWGPRRPPLASVPWPLQGQGHPRPRGRRRHPARLRHSVGLGALDVTVPVRL